MTAESSVEIPGAGQSVTATSKARLMSVEKVDGTEVANIDFNVDVPMDLTLDLGALLKEMGLDQMMPAGSDPQDLAFKMSLQGQEILDGSTPGRHGQRHARIPRSRLDCHPGHRGHRCAGGDPAGSAGAFLHRRDRSPQYDEDTLTCA